jgi:hypothetical protein
MAMRIYTVHLAPGAQPAEALLVKEGFSWPALFFGPVWALCHGLWLWAAIWIAVAACVGGMEILWPRAEGVLGVAELALMALFAAEANELRRRGLARQRFQEIGVVGGADLDTAARRFVDLAAIGAR